MARPVYPDEYPDYVFANELTIMKFCNIYID